jgi:hypothetical protein
MYITTLSLSIHHIIIIINIDSHYHHHRHLCKYIIIYIYYINHTGKLLQTRVIRDRLFRELDKNVALRVKGNNIKDGSGAS